MPGKLRVLTISKPYVAAAYRDKLRLMATDPRFEVGLVCPDDWAGQAFEQPADDAAEDYYCARLPIRFNGKNHFHLYRGLTRVLREFKPDVVNVEEEHYSAVTWQIYRAALASRAKVLFYTWQNIDKHYPPPFCWVEQYVFRHSLAAVVGNGEAGDILRRKGYRGCIAKLPQMGVNERLFPVTPLTLQQKNELKAMVGMKPTLPWVLFCGRLVAEKGVGDLLAACDTLARKGKELGVLLLGNGPDAPRLQDLARTLHPLVHVTFVPFVPSDQVPQYMRAADILCLPSHTRANWKEQFGRVLVEAMASSTVVVGSNSGEIPLVIDRHGLVFTEQEPASLAHELGRALDEPGLYERLQASALKHVAAHYTNRVIAANLCDLIWTQVHGGK